MYLCEKSMLVKANHLQPSCHPRTKYQEHPLPLASRGYGRQTIPYPAYSRSFPHSLLRSLPSEWYIGLWHIHTYNRFDGYAQSPNQYTVVYFNYLVVDRSLVPPNLARFVAKVAFAQDTVLQHFRLPKRGLAENVLPNVNELPSNYLN